MISRILLLFTLTAVSASAQLVNLNKLQAMAPKKVSSDVKFKGRELVAIEVALAQFRHDRFSTSGDLEHFDIELWREPGKLFVSFYPQYHEASSRALPARNKYGTHHLCCVASHIENYRLHIRA